MHGEVLAEKDMAKQQELRRQHMLCDFWFTSASAITEAGELVFADGTGTRMAPLLNSARNCVIVIGSNKITQNMEAALQRTKEFVLPVESARIRLITPYPGLSFWFFFVYFFKI